jgi:hypothetical protein
VRFRPFKCASQNIVNIIIELCIASCYSLSLFYAFDIEETGTNIVQWTIIGFVMLGSATNISLILYNTTIFIIKMFKHNIHINKVAQEDIRDDTIEIANKDTTNNNISFMSEDKFYINLKRRQRIDIP